MVGPRPRERRVTIPTARLREVFDHAIGLDPAAREAYLREGNLGEREREVLLGMLKADDELGEPSDKGRPRRHPWPGDVVGGFKLIAPIGSGGMGTVWRAASLTAPEVLVAVKFADWSRLAPEEAMGRLHQEGRVLAVLRHPGIVSLVDRGETHDGRPFLVLEELDGLTFDLAIESGRHRCVDLLSTLLQLCDAVRVVHEAGVVHRDIKPSNVLVSRTGAPVLVDFGAALVGPDSGLTRGHITQGSSPMTPAFASPEQSRGDAATAAADVFALGRLISLGLRASTDPDGPVGRMLQTVADRACSAEMSARHPDAAALSDDLRERFAGMVGTKRPRVGPAWLVGAIAAFSLVLGGTVGAVWFSGVETTTTTGESDGDTWADLPDDGVNRVIALLQRGNVGASREALVVAHSDEAMDPHELVELAELESRFGLLAAGLETLERIDPNDLDEGAQLRWRWWGYRCRQGLELEEDEGKARSIVLDSVEMDEADIEARVTAFAASTGDAEAVRRLVEFEDVEPDDVLSESALRLQAYVSLSNRLVIAGLSAPLSDDVLDNIEYRVQELLEEHPQDAPETLGAFVGLSTARMLAHIGANRDDLVREELLEYAEIPKWSPPDASFRHAATHLWVLFNRLPDTDGMLDETYNRLWDSLETLTQGKADENPQFMALLEDPIRGERWLGLQRVDRVRLGELIDELRDDDIEPWWFEEL